MIKSDKYWHASRSIHVSLSKIHRTETCVQKKENDLHEFALLINEWGFFWLFFFRFGCLLLLFGVFCLVFSSFELKAQVSFSDHLSSVVCPSVRLSVRTSVCLFVNFSRFHLLLQNHWANFNQTWQKASLGEGDSSLFKWRAPPFSKGR